MRKKRSPWAAFLFSVANPGLGHLYCGDWKRALFWYAALMVSSVAALWLLVHDPTTGVIAFIFSGILLPVIVGVDGYRLARRLGIVELKAFQRWYVYCAYFGVSLFLILPGVKDVLTKYVAESFEAPDDSMAPEVRRGDVYLAVTPFVSGSSYARGEIVIFTERETAETLEPWRIVALGGETVQVKGTEVLLNGRRLCEPYARWKSSGSRDFGPATVPPGSVFLLGDNRDEAKDARTWANPFLPVERIEGRVRLIFWNSEGEPANISKEFNAPPTYPENCNP